MSCNFLKLQWNKLLNQTPIYLIKFKNYIYIYISTAYLTKKKEKNNQYIHKKSLQIKLFYLHSQLSLKNDS